MKDILWPKINSIECAVQASRQGFIASLFVASVSPIYITLELVGNNALDYFYLAFAPVFIFVLLAGGIYKVSRVAVVIALILTLPTLPELLQSRSGFKFASMAVNLGLVNSLRGTFAYHKFKKEETVRALD